MSEVTALWLMILCSPAIGVLVTMARWWSARHMDSKACALLTDRSVCLAQQAPTRIPRFHAVQGQRQPRGLCAYDIERSGEETNRVFANLQIWSLLGCCAKN